MLQKHKKTKLKMPSTKSHDMSKSKTLCKTLGIKKKSMSVIEISEKTGIGKQTCQRMLNYLKHIGLVKSTKTNGVVYWDRHPEARNLIHHWIKGHVNEASMELKRLIKELPIPQIINEYLEKEPDHEGTIDGLAEIFRRLFLESDKELKDEEFFKIGAKFWVDLCAETKLIESLGNSFRTLNRETPSNPVIKPEDLSESGMSEMELDQEEIQEDETIPEIIEVENLIKIPEEEAETPSIEPQSMDKNSSLNALNMNYNVDISIDGTLSLEVVDKVLEHLNMVYKKAEITMNYHIKQEDQPKEEVKMSYESKEDDEEIKETVTIDYLTKDQPDEMEQAITDELYSQGVKQKTLF